MTASLYKGLSTIEFGALRRRSELFTSEEIDAFTQADCHVLAIELHRRTGWPVWAFHWDEPENEYLLENPDIHAVVQTPTGHFLDVCGVSTRTQLTRFWLSGGQAEYIRLEPVDSISVFNNWPVQIKGSRALARDVAQRLLDCHFPSVAELQRPVAVA